MINFDNIMNEKTNVKSILKAKKYFKDPKISLNIQTIPIIFIQILTCIK